MEVILISIVVSLIVNMFMKKRLTSKRTDSKSSDNCEGAGIGVEVPDPGKAKPPLEKN